MKTMNEWLNEGRKNTGSEFVLTKRVTCADGYSVSIQASSGHYCRPRITEHDVATYSAFELGFPSSPDNVLMPYAEDESEPTVTVYPYVPRDILEQVIESHGGIVGFEESPTA